MTTFLTALKNKLDDIDRDAANKKLALLTDTAKDALQKLHKRRPEVISVIFGNGTWVLKFAPNSKRASGSVDYWKWDSKTGKDKWTGPKWLLEVVTIFSMCATEGMCDDFWVESRYLDCDSSYGP